MVCDLSVIILAAGKGIRMQSSRTKVLHHVCGRPILGYVLAAAQGIDTQEILVVIGDPAEDVQVELREETVTFVIQREPLGTGHAVLQAKDYVAGNTLLIVPGDLPLLTTEVLQGLLGRHREERADLSVLTMGLAEPGDYGRLVRDRDGRPIRIVEARDATADELGITEVNTGIYCVQNDAFLWESLEALDATNAQSELYLTDLVEQYRAAERPVLAAAVPDAQVVMGVNSRAELASANQLMRLRIARALMESGATIVDPERTHIDFGVTVGMDSQILPGTYLRGDSSIGERCTIGPDAWIDNSTVENDCRVWYATVEGARVRTDTTVGPYAHLRPGADVGPNVRIGNFVEVKASRVKRGAKAGHLTYLGDAEVGEEANIGAGTITCNYDGKRKHRTTIGDRAFIGSNASLVAPVTIGEDAIVGAGSTITEDVPPGSLGLGRARQVIKQPTEEPKEDEEKA